MAPRILTCFLDARIYSIIDQFVAAMTRVLAATNGAPVLFLLQLPKVHAELWRKELQKTFCTCQGYEEVMHYYVDCGDSGTPLAPAILLVGATKTLVKLSHVQVLEAPLDIVDSVAFGDMIIYVELQFKEPRAAGHAHTIGVLWASDILCKSKPYFNESNFRGVFEIILAAMELQRYMSLMETAVVPSLTAAHERMLDHLDGLVLTTDVRSKFFDEDTPIHHWKMSGKVHAVQGTVVHGEFHDTYAGEILTVAPPCYKIYFRAKPLFVPSHSMDLWSENHWKAKTARENRKRNKEPKTSSLLLSRSNQLQRAEERRMEQEKSKPNPQDPQERMKEENASQECMVCLARPPTCVFDKCGHLGVCGHCGKWMLCLQYNKGKAKANQLAPAQLKMSKLEKVCVNCPCCRKSTRILHISKYKGVVFAL